MKLSYILGCLNQLKVHHWFTGSYAEHKALQKAYESLDEKFDSFIEVYLGKYGKGEYIVSSYELTIDGWDSSKPMSEYYTSMRTSLVNYLRGILNPEGDRDLLNIVDDIESEFNQLIYLLRLR